MLLVWGIFNTRQFSGPIENTGFPCQFWLSIGFVIAAWSASFIRKNMSNFESWSKFAKRCATASPLNYVWGSRRPTVTSKCCSPHSHRSIEIVYHPSGSGVTRFDAKRSINYRERDVIIYAPDEVHDQETFTEGEDICIHLEVPKGFKAPRWEALHISHVTDPLLIEEIGVLSQMRPSEDQVNKGVCNFRATAILLALTQLACTREQRETASVSERRVLLAEHYIRENSSTIKTIQETAKHVGIGYDFLRHIFSKARGKSLVRYLNEVRIHHVKTLLVHSTLSLKEIAPLCGFSDEYYLSTVFRKMTGTGPSHYRKHYQGKDIIPTSEKSYGK
jgi:AraC-like DNA-binding protein